MNELLTTSLVWRLCAMLAGWLRRSPLGRGMRALGRLWRESATYRLFAWLLKRPCAVESSAYCAASVLWGRIFLKEKLSWKHYVMIALVVIGIVMIGVFDI